MRLISSSILLGLVICCSAGQAAEEDVGPVVGHIDATSARLLVRRGAKARKLRLLVIDASGKTVSTNDAICTSDNDFVGHFHATGLKAGQKYRYRIAEVQGNRERVVVEGPSHHFTTATDQRMGKSVTVCFTSCVDIEKNPMWADMQRLQPNMLFLMGDTPYIDRTNLDFARKRHRDFLNMPGLAELVRNTPTVGTWDDHDFGLNNGNGRNLRAGKGQTRRAFVEYRAHAQYGNGREGVYHSVDLGMIEVFLLDPRYFSQTEPSMIDPKQPTCYGKDQWKWLLSKLKASKAPFKVLASGSIWQDKKNSETDDMFTYWYERDALLDFIAKERISGVVLLGGDIHVSRHLVHPLRVGYDLHDFVISPGHERTITQLDVYHPSLRWSLVEGQQFLSMTAEGEGNDLKLTAKFLQGGGKENREVVLPLHELTAKAEGTGLRKGLRAHWSFDKDFSNSSRLGKSLDALPTGGPTIVPRGRRGSSVRFSRSNQQFLSVAKNPLDDNSNEHTLSMWFRPSQLPKHGTTERMFLIESTAEGKPSNKRAWHLSLGLRACDDPAKVNLQLYTHTLVPAGKPEAAPTARSQGGFDLLVNRNQLSDWTHIVSVFDSKTITLFLNGKQALRHKLAAPGPASEFGGLILGGHREGVGRNFDGSIDETAIWSRGLSVAEIKQLHAQGLPE